MSGVIRTDYVSGQDYKAEDHNAENLAILNAGGGLLSHGATIYYHASGNGMLGARAFSTDNKNISVGFVVSKSYFYVYNYDSGEISGQIETKNTWADCNYIRGIAVIGDYLYALLHDSNTDDNRVYRYSLSSLSSGGTLMSETFLGTSGTTFMSSDGTDLFFNNDGANSTNYAQIRRASISGTTLSSVETITCTPTSTVSFYFCVSENYIYFYTGDTATREIIRCNKTTGAEIQKNAFGYSTYYYGLSREVFIVEGKMMYAEGYSRYNKSYTLFDGEKFNL